MIWSVSIESRGTGLPPTAEQMHTFHDVVGTAALILSNTQTSYGASIAVDAPKAHIAFVTAQRIYEKAVSAAQLPAWDILHIEVTANER